MTDNHENKLLCYESYLHKIGFYIMNCYPANIYLFKLNYRNTRKSLVFDVVLLLLLTLNIFHMFSTVSIIGFEQVNVSWVTVLLLLLLLFI